MSFAIFKPPSYEVFGSPTNRVASIDQFTSEDLRIHRLMRQIIGTTFLHKKNLGMCTAQCVLYGMHIEKNGVHAKTNFDQKNAAFLQLLASHEGIAVIHFITHLHNGFDFTVEFQSFVLAETCIIPNHPGKHLLINIQIEKGIHAVYLYERKGIYLFFDPNLGMRKSNRKGTFFKNIQAEMRKVYTSFFIKEVYEMRFRKKVRAKL